MEYFINAPCLAQEAVQDTETTSTHRLVDAAVGSSSSLQIPLSQTHRHIFPLLAGMALLLDTMVQAVVAQAAQS